MPTHEFEVQGSIAADAAAVWAIVRTFSGKWHPAIASIRAEQDARGALIRAFTVHGEETIYREQVTWFSDSDRSLAYTHLEGIAGATAYDASIRVNAKSNSGSKIIWTARIEAPEERLSDIADGTRAVFEAGISALGDLGRTPKGDQPNLPAATEAMPQIDIETVSIPGSPKIALSVTPPREGPICLFLHGIGGSRHNWNRQLAAAGKVMRCAAMDLRGYGDSQLGDGQTTIDDYCNDILRARDHLGAEKLVLCGLSYGAWIATSFAMRHPGVLAGLALSGGCTGMSEASEEVRTGFRTSRQGPLDEGKTPADFAEGVVNVIAGPDAPPAMRAELHESMAAIPSATYRDALHCFTNPGEQFDFSRLTMPVLMMTGEHDRLAPPDEIRTVSRRVAEQAERAFVRFEVLAGAGHVCNIEAADQYNAHLAGLLGKIASLHGMD